ncbi:hypothetical protein PQD13_gp27 [Gordonia phage Clawz]|uniref:Uncharacterized protein n=1 Tax=Gordonia phage Clawz TaxID=2743910 RepID=A0AAE7F8D9_9CAUD|nr:hypothetical protein PQD13_gp27 [Gordonia phage Clawz]QKY79939.1 hypothetical protein SEA_CLAWZ_27 [Gordonia phage Clawz]
MISTDYQVGDSVKHLSVRHPFTSNPAIGLVSGHTSDGYVLVSFPEPLRTLKVWPDDLVLQKRLTDTDDTTYPLIGEYVDKELMNMTDAAETAARAAVRKDRHPGTVHLLDLFEYGHLPPHLALISAKFEVLAHDLVIHLSDGPELTAGLRKLVEAKDCAVRQAVIDAKTD